jgi:hypothetical protein
MPEVGAINLRKLSMTCEAAFLVTHVRLRIACSARVARLSAVPTSEDGEKLVGISLADREAVAALSAVGVDRDGSPRHCVGSQRQRLLHLYDKNGIVVRI